MTRLYSLITILLTMFSLFSHLDVQSQKPVSFYKATADSSLKNFFDSRVMKNISCTYFDIHDDDGSSEYYFNDNKNKKFHFKTIVFEYALYSSELKYNFRFFVEIDIKNKVAWDSSITRRVPECIRKMRPCNFINSEESRKIAINDSIEHPDNLGFQLERNKLDKEYYWMIIGHEKENYYPANSKVRIRTSSVGTPRNHRFINAKTGKIVNWNEFKLDW